MTIFKNLWLASFIVVFGGATTAQTVDRPNIIVMIADDMGWADAPFNAPDLDLPGLARLATEGVVFDRFYATLRCTPTL